MQRAPQWPTFWLWPEHQQAFALWSAVGDQWRVDGEGNRRSLDHAAVESGMRMLRIPRGQWPELYEQMRVMAHASAHAWAQQRQRRPAADA